MSLSLYRKWRPQNFEEVVGQNHIKTTLINALLSNRIAHAYLFTGPRGVGKTTIARILAKAVNCLKPKNGEPCNNCSTCKEITEGKSLDLIEIDGASNRGIDEIRELREKIKFTPHSSKFKVFIIDEVHMLTKEAFNALLKTLEEPPAHAIFILATTEVSKIPATVLSRCQRFNFSKLSLSQIIEELEKIVKEEKIKASKETLRVIASYSEGAMRDAVNILDQVSSFGNKTVESELVESILGLANIKIVKDLLKKMVLGETGESFRIINEVLEEGIDINLLIDTLIEKTRDLLFLKIGGLETFLNYEENELKDLKELALKAEVSKLAKSIEILSDAKQKTKFSTPLQLPLELAILEIGEEEKKPELETKPEKEEPAAKVLEPEKRETGGSPKEIRLSKENSDILSSVKNNWQKIVEELKSYNHSLSVCLKTAKPERIENNTLLLGFDFSFHKDKIQSLTNKRIVEDVIKKVTGKFIPIRCFVNPKKAKEKSVIEDAADILGGEIIE